MLSQESTGEQQMVQIECPRHENPSVSLRLGGFIFSFSTFPSPQIHFPISSLLLSRVIRIGFPQYTQFIL